MQIALAGPIQVDALLPWLEDSGRNAQLPPGRGGTAVTQLAIGLLRRSCRVCVTTLDSRVRQPLHLRGEFLDLRIAPYRTRHRARDGFRDERRFVRDALRSADPDVVHAHWTYEYALGALATSKPTVVTVRDWAPTVLRYHPDLYRVVRLMMALGVLWRADELTVASPYMASLVRRWTARNPFLVPNTLDDDLFQERCKGPDREAPKVLAVNQGFSTRKNVTTLLRAFVLVRRHLPGAHLLLIGDGYGPGSSAEAWAAARDLTDGVTFQGPVAHHDLFDYYRSADVFVHPSREESFGNVLLEAMSQGLPVVAGEQSGAPAWVLEGGAGALVDVNDPQELSTRILEVLCDPAEWWELSGAGYARAHRDFRLSPSVDRYLDIYQRLL